MKDYTKYDFAAIVGAEVEIHYHAGEPLIVKLIHFNNESKLLVCVVLAKNAYDIPVGRIEYVHVQEIALITARIKVEDMSVKQLKRLLKTYQAPGLEHIFVIAENGVHHSIMTTWEEVGKQDFADYVDCTDWGWEHE